MHIGYAAGVYDLFHIGHPRLLQHAKEQCDHLVAGVVSDEMLREVKGVESVIPTVGRAEIVAGVAVVDQVHVETTPSKMDAWRAAGHAHRASPGPDGAAPELSREEDPGGSAQRGGWIRSPARISTRPSP